MSREDKNRIGFTIALDVLYTSDTFTRLQDNETGFYYQSSGYVFDFLNKEITEGQMK